MRVGTFETDCVDPPLLIMFSVLALQSPPEDGFVRRQPICPCPPPCDIIVETHAERVGFEPMGGSC